MEALWDRVNRTGAIVGDKVNHYFKASASVAPTTPKKAQTFHEMFDERKNPNAPSPPCKEDKSTEKTHKELKEFYPGVDRMRDSQDPSDQAKYMKLLYACEKKVFERKGLFEPANPNLVQKSVIGWGWRWISRSLANKIIDPNTIEGENFEALYNPNTGGDKMYSLTKEYPEENGIETYEDTVASGKLGTYIEELRQSGADNIYEVFRDSDHDNLEPYYRIQKISTCFAHAPILLHFYLQLFYDKELAMEDAMSVNLTRFIRNKFVGSDLVRYLQDEGFPINFVTEKLHHSFSLLPFDSNLSFDIVASRLKKWGPAIVSLGVGPDVQKKGKWVYEGKRPDSEKIGGHAMILVTVFKYTDPKDEDGKVYTYYAMQNFWEGKQFLLFREDYFLSCTIGEVKPRFNWIIPDKPNQLGFENPEKIYAKKAGNDRIAVASPMLERANDFR